MRQSKRDVCLHVQTYELTTVLQEPPGDLPTELGRCESFMRATRIQPGPFEQNNKTNSALLS